MNVDTTPAKPVEGEVSCTPSGEAPEMAEKPKGCFDRNKKPIAILMFLISGTASVCVNKILYGIKSEGIDGSVHRFEKPWFTNWAMFLGMTLCLIGFFISRAIKKAQGKPVEVIPTKLYWALLIPATCDMVASYLMGVGLLWISSSIWQMLRGSILIFTAIFKVTYRKKKLFPAEIFGLIAVICALVIVGVSSFFTPGEVVVEDSSSLLSSDESSSGSSSQQPESVWFVVAGISLVVAAQAIQAFQTILEEKFLHDLSAPETLIVGMEGLYGFLLCSCITMPIAYFLPVPEETGFHEDTLDSFVMLGNNMVLLGVVILYVVVILVFNLSGMMITQVTDAMTRNIMEPIRTFLVWAFMVFACLVFKTIGERINLWSLLQLSGFIVLTFGVLVYNDVIHMKCLHGAPAEEQKPEGNPDDEKKPLIVNGAE